MSVACLGRIGFRIPVKSWIVCNPIFRNRLLSADGGRLLAAPMRSRTLNGARESALTSAVRAPVDAPKWLFKVFATTPPRQGWQDRVGKYKYLKRLLFFEAREKHSNGRTYRPKAEGQHLATRWNEVPGGMNSNGRHFACSFAFRDAFISSKAASTLGGSL